jgi:hypothetical protein
MPITVTCQACGQSFSLRDDLAGRSVRCRCGRPLAVPSPDQGVLGGLLDAELARSGQRPPERKAPVHRAETSSAPQAPAHSALLPSGLLSTATAPPQSPWVVNSRVALRSLVGAAGLGYGMVMLWVGANVAWIFAILGTHGGLRAMPWFDLIFVGTTLCGVLLAVASVGVLIGRKDAGPKLRFAAWTLVVLWIASSILLVVVRARNAIEIGVSEFTAEFWREAAHDAAVRLTWAIVPALIFLWCLLAAKRDLTA